LFVFALLHWAFNAPDSSLFPSYRTCWNSLLLQNAKPASKCVADLSSQSTQLPELRYYCPCKFHSDFTRSPAKGTETWAWGHTHLWTDR